MKYRRILSGTMVVMLGIALISGCSRKPETTAAREEVIPVEVAPVTRHVIDRTLELTGNIEPYQMNNLGAQMSGRIQKIYVDAGDRVHKGDILVQMDDAQLTQARVQYQLAKQDFERMKPLLEEGSISPSQFDKIKGAYESAKAAYELVLENTRIRAPFSGVVTRKWMNEGEVFLLFPGAAGLPAIVTLMQINPVKIKVNVPESDFPHVRKGMPATIRVDVLPGKSFGGKVSRLEPTIDPLTRTFGVEVEIPNPDETLRPGMFARVSLKFGTDTVVAVPRSALVNQVGTGKYFAFVVENGIARRRDVVRGNRFDSLIEIRQGIRPGEQIVVSGQYRLKDGAKVSVAAPAASQGNKDKENGAQ